jgi:hypothetical protein
MDAIFRWRGNIYNDMKEKWRYGWTEWLSGVLDKDPIVCLAPFRRISQTNSSSLSDSTLIEGISL